MNGILAEAVSKHLEIERALSEVESKINAQKAEHKKLEETLEDQESTVKSSLQTLDYLENLKAQRLAELKKAENELSDAEKKALNHIKGLLANQDKLGLKVNSLLLQLKEAYTELLDQAEVIDRAGFRSVFQVNHSSLDLPEKNRDRNPHTWLMNLPAYRKEPKIPYILLMSAQDCASRGQKVL